LPEYVYDLSFLAACYPISQIDEEVKPLLFHGEAFSEPSFFEKSAKAPFKTKEYRI